MPESLTVHLSEAIPEPELSKMWESERTTFDPGPGDGIDTFLTAPEMVIEAQGNDVRLSFPSGGEPGHEKLKAAFERAVHRYRPEVRLEWTPQEHHAQRS
jgi:hypothetical protein